MLSLEIYSHPWEDVILNTLGCLVVYSPTLISVVVTQSANKGSGF